MKMSIDKPDRAIPTPKKSAIKPKIGAKIAASKLFDCEFNESAVERM